MTAAGLDDPFARIASRFALGATVTAIQPHGRGLINDTFLVTLDTDPPRAYTSTTTSGYDNLTYSGEGRYVYLKVSRDF